MPKICRLSFLPNFILAISNSILSMKIYAFRVYGVASKNITTKASLYEFTAGCGHFELVGNLFLGFFLSQTGKKW